MAEYSIPRLMLAATGSSAGKTTVTLALLKALQNRGISPAAFKCGPDYIDPMFHARVLGVEGRNLDLFFTQEDVLSGLLVQGAAGKDVAVLEGVMGYYDGVGGKDIASSWHVARVTQTPVVLVLDPKGMSLSAAAVVRGFLELRSPHQIVGILLNRCSKALYQYLSPLLEEETGIPVLGHLPLLPECAIESRHLGLVTAGEIQNLNETVDRLAQALEEHTDLDRLLELARSAPKILAELPNVKVESQNNPVIAVARDAAFCFYYRENLELLEALGARIVYFSPLEDEALPPGTSALYLGGGYPELYAERLSQNIPMGQAVARAVEQGMPTLAECGGFQYLQQYLTDAQGNRYPMAGVLEGESKPLGRLVRFGYITLTAGTNTLLCDQGDTIAAHEFHYWDSTQNGDACSALKPVTGKGWPCIIARGNLFAGYPHLYFHSNPSFARRFVRATEKYQEEAYGR